MQIITFERITDGYDKLREGNWQVIFKNKDGLDYCRETKPGTWTQERVAQWATTACQAYSLGCAVIERW